MKCPCKTAVALWQRHSPDKAWVRCEMHAFTHWDNERQMAYQGEEPWEARAFGQNALTVFKGSVEPRSPEDHDIFSWTFIHHPSLVPPRDRIVKQDFDAFHAEYFPEGVVR